MIDDHMDMLAPALFSLGYPLNTSDESQLKAAFDILKRQAPSVLTYEYGITFLESSELKNELYMVEVYSGDQQVLNEITGKDVWHYVVPEEGTVLWVDCLAVLNDSEKKSEALQFINFLNRPDIAALNSEDLHVASPNTAAREFMSPEFLNNTEVFISKASRDKSEVYSILDMHNQRLRKRITQAIRTYHDSE